MFDAFLAVNRLTWWQLCLDMSHVRRHHTSDFMIFVFRISVFSSPDTFLIPFCSNEVSFHQGRKFSRCSSLRLGILNCQRLHGIRKTTLWALPPPCHEVWLLTRTEGVMSISHFWPPAKVIFCEGSPAPRASSKCSCMTGARNTKDEGTTSINVQHSFTPCVSKTGRTLGNANAQDYHTIPYRSGQANVKRIIFCKDCNKDSRDLTRALHNPLVLGATCSKVRWLGIIMQVEEQ